MPWYLRKRVWASHLWGNESPQARLKAFWQRGRRGWADKDAWSADKHIASVVGEMLDYLINYGHLDRSEYIDEMHEARDSLLHYANNDFLDIEDLKEYEALNRGAAENASLALKWVGENLPRLWD